MLKFSVIHIYYTTVYNIHIFNTTVTSITTVPATTIDHMHLSVLKLNTIPNQNVLGNNK